MRKLSILAAALAIAAGQSYIGQVDTIGGTTCDWQTSGPALRWLALSQGITDSAYGIHAVWMYSSDLSNTTFPDRNMRYNFYDAGVGGWNWPDLDFMQSGVNIFGTRSGCGNVANEPRTGLAVVSRHFGSGTLQLGVGKDVSVGAGVFNNCDGPASYRWPVIDVGSNGWIHCGCIGDSGLSYARCTTWCNWEGPQRWDSATFPTHNIAASKTSLKVCMAWVATAPAPAPLPAYYRTSEDGGTTWGAITQLDCPPAYGGDTVTTFHVTSMFPFYDRERDLLHIVACVNPMLGDTTFPLPAEIWHFCPDNTPQWTEIHRANTYHLLAPIGYNALNACRPSMGEYQSGGLYVAWEQFDSINYEPGPPERLRADIFCARDNSDNGASWVPGVRITEPGTWSCRFPSVIDFTPSDTVRVAYLIDQHAGFFLYGEGPATNNPIVVHKVRVAPPSVTGRERASASLEPTAAVIRRVLFLPPSLPTPDFLLLSTDGRKVLDLHPGANDVRSLSPGVYFVRPASGVTRDASCVSKVLVVR